MSKKTATILILLIVTIIFAVVGFWYYQKTTGTRGDTSDTSFFNFFPFGKPPVDDEGNLPPGGGGDNPPDDGEGPVVVELPKLHKISDEPVAGGIVFTANAVNTVRYIERATGHIYQVPFDSMEKDRVSITTIPKIYESVWAKNGDGVVVRYLKESSDTIETFSLNLQAISGASAGAPAEGVFFPKNTLSISINPKKESVFYLVPNQTGATGFTATPTNTNKVQVFNSPLKEWAATWPKEDTIALIPKPAHGILGHLFFLNTKTNKLTKVLSRIPGLTALANNDASVILYAKSINNITQLYVKNLKTGATREMPFSTLPEKCVWSQTKNLLLFCAVPKSGTNSTLPDSWYQGIITFNDQVWQTDIETGATDLVADPDQLVATSLDIVDISLAPDDSVMTFTNKKDLTYWGLRLR